MNRKFQALHNKITQAFADDCFAVIGIRATRSKVESKIGRELKESCVWEDGHRTNKRLNGVCTIGIKDDSKETLVKALQLLGGKVCKEFGINPKEFTCNYDGLDIILVQGESCQAGEDIGESIIRNGITIWSANNT